jgi:hypothetical protein
MRQQLGATRLPTAELETCSLRRETYDFESRAHETGAQGNSTGISKFGLDSSFRR